MTRFSSRSKHHRTELGLLWWYIYPAVWLLVFVCIANATNSSTTTSSNSIEPVLQKQNSSGENNIVSGSGESANSSSSSSRVARKGVDFADTAKAVKNVVLVGKKKGKIEKSKLGGVKVENIGFAAEWEYQATPFPPQDVSPLLPSKANSAFPSQRIGPGTWLDPGTGNWWLFGGHQPGGGNERKPHSIPGWNSKLTHYLTDLWRYSPATTKWTLIYRPEISSGNTSGLQNNPATLSSTSSSSFSNIPTNISFPLVCGTGESSSGRKLVVLGTGNGIVSQNNLSKVDTLPISQAIWLYDTQREIWASYPINCPENPKTCPSFTRETIFWCDPSGISVLELQSTQNSTLNNTQAVNDNFANRWKFDTISTKWISLSPLNVSKNVKNLLKTGNCRVVPTMPATLANSTQSFVYSLCPSSTIPLLHRHVILYNPAKNSTRLLGTLHLNNAFTDKKIWQPSRSTLHSVFIPGKNISLIILAYHKLLDLWIHNHFTDKLYFAENVWKGESLRKFQTHEHFYQLSVSVEGLSQNYTVFMVNPRNKLASFGPQQQQPQNSSNFSPGRFQTTIVSDNEVFLPPRDAPLLPLDNSKATEAPKTPTVYQTNELSRNDGNKTIKIVSNGFVEKRNSSSKSNDQDFTSSVATTEKPSAVFSSTLPSQQKPPRRLMMMPMMKQKSKAGVGIASSGVGGSNKMVMSLGKRAKSSVAAPITSRLPHFTEVPSKFARESSTAGMATGTGGYSNVANGQTEILPEPLKLHKKIVGVSTPKQEFMGSTATARATTEAQTGTTTNVNNFEAQGYQNDDQYHNIIRSSGSGRVVGRASSNLGGEMVGVGDAIQMWHEQQQQQQNLENYKQEDLSSASSANIDPKIFFALTLSFFGSIGLITFVRRCVKCPIARGDAEPSILDKECLAPPVRYSVIPGDMPYHTPIV